MFNKRCLSRGGILDNKLYTYSLCLDKINAARRDVNLRRRFKKDALAVVRKITASVFIAISFAGIFFAPSILDRFNLPAYVMLDILISVLI